MDKIIDKISAIIILIGLIVGPIILKIITS